MLENTESYAINITDIDYKEIKWEIEILCFAPEIQKIKIFLNCLFRVVTHNIRIYSIGPVLTLSNKMYQFNQHITSM